MTQKSIIRNKPLKKKWQKISTDTTKEIHRWQISACKNAKIKMIGHAKCLQECGETTTVIHC